jgi:hypothetical protein
MNHKSALPKPWSPSSSSSSSSTKSGSWPSTPDVFGVLPKLESPQLLPTLPYPMPPEAPEVRFLTFSELLSPPAPEEKKRSEGLFMSLVKNPAILYQEYLEQPDMFEEETGHLLLKLIGRHKKLEDLTDSEMKKLDEAVVSYLQYKPKVAEKPKLRALPEEDEEDDEPEIPWGPNGVKGLSSFMLELPEGVDSRWWEKT